MARSVWNDSLKSQEKRQRRKRVCFGGANVNNRSQLNVTFDPSFGASSFVSPSPSHSVKYALESLYQLILANGLSEKEAEIFIWNRTVNNHGGLGKNIPHDLEVEHSNNYNKQGFGNLGVNLTEKAVTRICRAEKPVRGLIGKVDKSLQRFIRSGKHVQRSLMKWSKSSWRMMFSVIKRDEVTDILKDLNMSKCYTWINDHKNKFSSGVKARWSLSMVIYYIVSVIINSDEEDWDVYMFKWVDTAFAQAL